MTTSVTSYLNHMMWSYLHEPPIGGAEEPRATSVQQQGDREVIEIGDPKPQVVDFGVAATDVVELDFAVSNAVEAGVAVSNAVELGDATPEVEELCVAASDVVELGDVESEVVELGVAVLALGGAEPEGVKLGVAVSEVVDLGDAEAEVVELGVVVCKARTQDQVQLVNDGAARFSSETVGAGPAVTGSLRQARSGQKGTSRHSFNPGNVQGRGWDSVAGRVYLTRFGGGIVADGRRNVRGDGDQQQRPQRGVKCSVGPLETDQEGGD